VTEAALCFSIFKITDAVRIRLCICICVRIRDTPLKLLIFGLRKLLVIWLVLRYICPAEIILLEHFIWMAMIFHRALNHVFNLRNASSAWSAVS
jgi:hypothetical protein